MPSRHPYRALPGLKDELETKLDQSWGCTRSRVGYHAKVCRTNAGIGRRELRAVEEVKELGAELESQPVVGTKLGSLEQGKVKVVHARAAEICVGAGLIAESEVRG